jgi:hypothetical protein
MNIRELTARRDELQGDRADFMARDNSDAREDEWNQLHGAKLRMALEALDAAEPFDEPAEGVPKRCECDNTHEQNGTVCRWCWAHGRRVPSDPDIVTDHPLSAK